MTDPNKPTIYVATYEHRHGTDIRLFSNAEAAETWRQAIAQEWWENAFVHPMPEADTPAQIANTYFDALNDEWFNVQQATIDEETA